MEKITTECSSCGNKLDLEEAESPREDVDGDAICDECYHDKFEFTCCDCQEYGHIDDQHKMLVVFEETSGVLPGIHRIKKKPYYTHALIGSGWLHPECFTRIADINPDMDSNGYPCGHLCGECQGHINAQRKAKCSICKTVQASCLRVKLGSWKDVNANVYQWTPSKIVCAGCRHAHRGAWKRIAA